jgi:DNA processing protein
VARQRLSSKKKKGLLRKIDGIGTYIIDGLSAAHHCEAAESELKFIREHDIEVHYFLSESYPENLKHCIDGPVLLFSRGRIELQNKRIISVVGSRKATTYGLSFCEQLIETLRPYNPVIVSGFAYGIDIAAHKAALKNNLQTIACLAHGLNQLYPKSHSKYAVDIEAHGGFYTDFWSSDEFDRTNFLKRNRIIAGISQATVVIESAEKGGSLVTADIANSYDREVFALPGRATDHQSVGCNNLIKFQKAHLLSTPMDIPYMLDWQLESEQEPVVQRSLFVELNVEEKKVFNYLHNHPKALLDVIALECEIPAFKLAGLLLNMELKGVLRPLPGKRFELV